MLIIGKLFFFAFWVFCVSLFVFNDFTLTDIFFQVQDAAKALGMEMGEISITRVEEHFKDSDENSKVGIVFESSSIADTDDTDESTDEEEEEEEEEEDVDELLKEDAAVSSNAEAYISDEFHPEDESKRNETVEITDFEMEPDHSESVEKDSTEKDFEMKKCDDGDEGEDKVEDNDEDHSLMENLSNTALDEPEEDPKDLVEELEIEGNAEVGKTQENQETSETDDDELGSDSENSSPEKENSIVTDVEKIEQLKVELNEEIKMPSYREIIPEKQEEADAKRFPTNGCPCPICEYNPSAPAKLKEHLALKHFAENIKADYMKDDKECPIDDCEKEFANSGSLVRHIGSTHGKVSGLKDTQKYLKDI